MITGTLTFFRRYLLENPLAGRLMSTAMTGPKLGGAFLLVTLSLLITYITLFCFFLEEGQAIAASHDQLGSLLLIPQAGTSLCCFA